MTDQSSSASLAKTVIDLAASSTLVAAFFQWLPTVLNIILAFVSIVWFALQISDHPRITEFLARRRERIRQRKLRILMAKQKIIQAKIVAAGRVTEAKAEAAKIVEKAKTDAALTQVLDKNVDTFNS
jgi:F0F1-type ATP synthase membrane subunit b/b'